MSYRHLIAHERRFVAVGFALCFFSSYGQTYFIGVFGGVIRQDFGLSDGAYGALYSAATLTSAGLLLWLGRAVDRHNLRAVTGSVCLGLALATAGIASATSPAFLFLALVLLRLSGQGLMGHIAMTSMARYFDTHRAKAISLAALGFAAGEAVWPIAATRALAAVDWRVVWYAISGTALLFVAPLLWTLLADHRERHRAYLARLDSSDMTEASESPETDSTRHWTRGEVLRNSTFYFLVPAATSAPMIVTGMFFHQVRISEMRGWPPGYFGSCFVAFALAGLVTTLWMGPLVDRHTARRIYPLLPLPMAAGLAVLVLFQGNATCILYLALFGAAVGATSTVTGALWAEIYGLRHLGAIRALSSAVMVFSTALAPILVGTAIDAGASAEKISGAWMAYALVAAILAAVPLYSRAAARGTTE